MALNLPVVNGSSGTWGGILNDTLTDIDNRITTAANASSDLGDRIATLESGSKLTIATSTNRPVATAGQIVLETDTGFLYYVITIGGTPTRLPFPGSYVAKLKKTNSQNYGNGSAGAVFFTATDFDRLGSWTAANPSRYTATVAGAYEFTGAIGYAASNTTGTRQAWWAINGTAQNCTLASVAGTSTESTVVVARPAILSLAPGQYVELIGMQTSGGTIATDATTSAQPSMSVKYLGYNV